MDTSGTQSSYTPSSSGGVFVIVESDLANNTNSPDALVSFMYHLPSVPQTQAMHGQIVTAVADNWGTIVGYRGISGATITLPSSVKPYPDTSS